MHAINDFSVESKEKEYNEEKKVMFYKIWMYRYADRLKEDYE